MVQDTFVSRLTIVQNVAIMQLKNSSRLLIQSLHDVFHIFDYVRVGLAGRVFCEEVQIRNVWATEEIESSEKSYCKC